VTVIRPTGVTTAASSCGLPELLAKAQHDTGDGPCVSAIRERSVTVAQDLRYETRWPGWTAWAVDHGVRGVLTAPVDIDDQVVGALSLYTMEPDRFSPDIELTAMLIAEHAGLLIAGVLDRSRLSSQTAELTEALGDGETVNRAIGIVMGQRSCGAEDALEVLQAASTTLRIPLTAVAERLVDTVASRALPPRQRG
jgi:GAF domain-containing protein